MIGADTRFMMIVLFIGIVWMLTAGLALTLFSAARNADKRAAAMLVEARVSARPRRLIG